MQLQLSLKIADRLHRELLVRGEPIEATEAASLLLSTTSIGLLSADILRALVRDDRRFCWASEDGGRLALRTWGLHNQDLAAVPFVALDLETTGAKAGPGKITEIGAVRIEGLRPVGRLHSLVNPQRAIPPMITRITGISDSMVANAPRIEEIMPALLEFLDGAVVVAHNAPFDVGFLNYELHRLCSCRLDEGAIDTLPLSRALVPGLPNYRLATVAEALGSPVAACHRALEDAEAVAHVFVHLAGVMQDRDLGTLEALRQHGRQSNPPLLDKLSLTRDLPEGPGVYLFLGEEDDVLLTGSASRLADEVRSVFLPGPRQHRGVRTAARSVERIEHQPAATPLEALVREHELSLEHAPPHNAFRVSPEKYVYIRAGGAGPGLALFVSRQAPRPQRPGDDDNNGVILGPFRRRSSAQAAVTLLRQCYPIRHCPRQGDKRPCERGTLGLCLSPCTGSPETRAEHDRQVERAVRWLAGSEPFNGRTGPLRQAKRLAEALRTEGSDGKANAVDEATSHLRAIRRACERLADANQLNFVLLWPECDGERKSVRLNLVTQGLLRATASLCKDTLEEGMTTLEEDGLRTTTPSWTVGPDGSLAAPQAALDCILAVRQWFREGDHTGGVVVPLRGACAMSLAEARVRIVAEARGLLGE